MIRNQWYAVMDSREIKKSKPVGAARMGEKLVFWASAGRNGGMRGRPLLSSRRFLKCRKDM